MLKSAAYSFRNPATRWLLLQSASTFLDAGWDFGGETANGNEDIWWINEGKDYPRLWWELIPEN